MNQLRIKTCSLVGTAYTITLEGNIGSGKSSVLKHFYNHPLVEAIPEPVEEWRNCNGINLLEEFYKNPRTNAAVLQSYIAKTFVDVHNAPAKKKVRILERSFFAAEPFINALVRTNSIHPVEVTVIRNWRNYLLTDLVRQNSVIYLRTDPTILHERINARDRKEELSIPLSYLTTVHEEHDTFFLSHDSLNVIIVDANQALYMVIKEVEQIVHEVLTDVALDSQRFL
jgi:deoxyadenosine/deoxycytidine kinase